MESELQSRWGGMDMRAGHVFTFKGATAAGLSTFGSARNSPHSTVFGLNKSPSLPWVIAAQAAAAVEFSGGNDPAIPFRGLSLPDVLAPAEADHFTQTERNLVLHDGISTIIFDESGAAIVEQVVTTYQTNSFGLDDRSLLKLNTKWTVDYMRYVFRSAVARDYPAHKLASDDVLGRIAPGQKIATPRLITNTLIAAAAQLEYVGLLEDLAGFKRDIKVVRSEADECRVNAVIPPNVVNQFDVFAAAVQFIL
jgi:phage tail sheath gpL-like